MIMAGTGNLNNIILSEVREALFDKRIFLVLVRVFPAHLVGVEHLREFVK